MMELMQGIISYIQMGLLGIAILFHVIAYATGVFWRFERREVELSFTLWNFCSMFQGKGEICLSINSDNYLEEVILTSRATGGIVLLLMILLLGLSMVWFISQRNSLTNDLWLHARTLLLLLLVLFMLIMVTHSYNCPPKYKFGSYYMSQSFGWGWGLTLTSFIFVLPVCFMHSFEEVQLYRSNRNKT